MFKFFRYSRHDKRSKLPGWILTYLRDANLNLSTDMAVHIARDVCLFLSILHIAYFLFFFLPVNGIILSSIFVSIVIQ